MSVSNTCVASMATDWSSSGTSSFPTSSRWSRPTFERLVAQTLADGTRGQGRGFVLMPSAAPNGRQITPRILKNYETMVRLAET